MIPERLPWHRSQWERMERSIRAGRVPHALLLHGAAGNGKARFAARLAATLLCRSSGPPCGECESCRLYAAGSHPDRFEVTVPEDRREIVVDQIRDLVHSVGLTARLGGYKVVIVDPAERMNRHAANTLLKTLEEPPGATVFILVSSNHALLLATIRSRCQMLDFPVAGRDLAVEWLRGNVRSPGDGHREGEEGAGGVPGPGRAGHARQRGGVDAPPARNRSAARRPGRAPDREHEPSPDPAVALDLARGAPIRALALLDGDLLAVRADLDRDLDEILAGGDPMTIASRWKEIGRATVTEWLVDILAERLRARVLRGADPGRRPAATMHFSCYLSMLDTCLEVRSGVLARSNANEQLALERLALEIAAEREREKRRFATTRPG